MHEKFVEINVLKSTKTLTRLYNFYKMESSIDVLNEEDLEDGEIFEDEESSATKSAPVALLQKPKPVQEPVATVQDKPGEPLKNHRSLDNNDKPQRDQRVPFFKGKRKLVENEDDERWKRDGKRNRRSHEFERDGEPGRIRAEGEPGEDEEEMMFVRGASPHRLDEEKGKWDRDGEEDDRSDMPRRQVRTFRGRGSISRRGDRQRGRGRGRGGMRGNKRKREDAEMCVFFLQGKCHRGSECPFAHEILPRKLELCKFYMKDCCAKKDKCLYMHSEFPCKYYHMGLKCYANKKCKFSHAPLTDATRNVLAKHLDTAPKDILGDYSRRDRDQRDRGDSRDMRGDTRDMRGDPRDMRGDSRDMRGDSRDMRGDSRDMRGDARDMRGDSRDMRGDLREMRGDFRSERDSRDMRGEFMRSKHDRDRKIPSLFDIKVSIPDDLRNSDGTHTPMPSPTQRSQDSTRSSDRDNYPADQERERDRDKEREKERDHEHERLKQEKAERKERKAKREKAREHRKERKERREKEKEKKRERSKDIICEKNEHEESDIRKNSPDIMSPTQYEDNVRNSIEGLQPVVQDKSLEEQDKKTGGCEINGLFPQHLPKKQQELFLRIQQQQREAENSQASANDEDEEEKAEEDNWYSSDEEAAPAPLPSLLTSLAQTTTVTPLLNILASASAAAKPLEVTPAPTPFIPTNIDLSNLSTVFEALTNLQKMNSVAKSVEQQQSTAQQQTTVVTGTTVVEQAESAIELPKPEPPRMRDPRLRSDIGCIEGVRRSIEGPTDMDLRPQPSVKSQVQPVPSGGDVDLRSLPFKPVQHSAANEIDASISSHIPIVWQLLPVDFIKSDYATLQIQPKPGVIDPRLRRVVRPPTDELGLPRDPRQRLMDDPVRDPRARQPLLATPSMPPTPRYDEDHRPQLYRMDSDMRQFPPPTPRLEDEVYSPGPSRPMDPRQRTKSIEDPRRTPGFSPRPDDIDLRPQMAHRVPFVNFK